MGRSTEHLSSKVGAGLSSFLNASFGNAAELIIGFSAVRAGLHEVVKASLTGAIIGNVLLVVGIAFLLGGLKYQRQQFNRTAASVGATLLLLSAIGLTVPALFHFVARGLPHVIEQELSLEISIVLFIVYLLSLVFTFRTHKHLYTSESDKEQHVLEKTWSTWKAVAVLSVSTILVILVSEGLVGSIEPTAKAIGMTDIFIGVILVAIIGNAVEHFSAIPFALKDRMDVSLGIAMGGSLQIALFVAPALVFLSYAVGKPMDLLFTTFEVAAVMLAVLVVNFVASDGESNWMEGILLLAVYVVMAMAFYFLP
jgi:Ca2+:H+ antiporter